MEEFLRNIGEQRHLNVFERNGIEIDVLKTLPANLLKTTLEELGLMLGTQLKIISAVESMKGKGIYTKIQNKSFLFLFSREILFHHISTPISREYYPLEKFFLSHTVLIYGTCLIIPLLSFNCNLIQLNPGVITDI